MIRILTLTGYNFFLPQGLLLKWDIEDTSEKLENYYYRIYRTTFDYDAFQEGEKQGKLHKLYLENNEDVELIAMVDATLFEFLDDTINAYRSDIQYYYEIYACRVDTQEVSTPVPLLYLFNKWTKKDIIGGQNYVGYIREIQKKYLQVINNTTGYILQKKRFGERCPYCWDDIRNQTSRYDCPCCFGTGYAGGYHRPYEVKFNYMTPVRISSENPRMEGTENSENSINVWIESYPLVYEGDIFIDEKNERYKVNSIHHTTKNNEYILRQDLTLTKLPLSDVVYKYELDKDKVIKYDI